MNAAVAEGALEQSILHLAGVDGGHGRVTKPSDSQGVLQLHLGPALRPQPPTDPAQRGGELVNMDFIIHI